MGRMGLPRKNVGLGCLLATAVLLASTEPVMASEPMLWHSSDGGNPYALPDTADVVWLQEPDLAGNSGSSEIIVPYDCNETLIAYGIYEYHTEIPPFDAQAGSHAWFSIQAADHDFPPQWGRLEAVHWEECDAAFRSEYFSYPDWVPAGQWWSWDASFVLYSGEWEGEACCFEDGRCFVATVETCMNHGGTPQGPGSDCDPNPCTPVRTEQITWGWVEVVFR